MARRDDWSRFLSELRGLSTSRTAFSRFEILRSRAHLEVKKSVAATIGRLVPGTQYARAGGETRRPLESLAPTPALSPLTPRVAHVRVHEVCR